MDSHSSAAGIYLHFPFCESKCPYCDFYSIPIDDLESVGFIEALLSEGMITIEDEFLRLTDKALFISNSVMVKLI